MLLGLLAAAVAAAPAFGDPRIDQKRAEEQQVLEQIHALDVQLEKATEAYDLANVKLDRIRAALRTNGTELVVARRNLKVAQSQLAARLKTLYVSGDTGSTLEILLGATSLDDFLNRIDTVNRVSDQDALVVREVKTFRHSVLVHGAELKTAHAEQKQVVAQRAAAKADVEQGLAEREQLVASIRADIVRLEAEERARQERLAREAHLRFLQQQEAARQQQAAQALGTQPAVGETASPGAPSPAPVVVGSSGVTPEGVTVAPPSRYGGAVGVAMQYLGTPYVWGGSSPGGFDCSGFVMYVYSQIGVSLPHNAAAQFGYGVPVSRDQLEPGDLVFFDGLGHVGIYIGGGQFIHSPHTGDVVKISSLDESWYASTFVGARRL
jgi:cell wall-associated NlpC family hydrolase